MAKASIKKRIKVTGTGKMVRRKTAQCHFRANKTGAQIRDKREGATVAKVNMKQIESYLAR